MTRNLSQGAGLGLVMLHIASFALAWCALAEQRAAHADVVVEVYHGGVEPASARGEVMQFRRALESKGVPWNTQPMYSMPQPGTRDKGVTFDDLLERIESGKRESVRVIDRGPKKGEINFAAGAELLRTAIADARANLELVVVQPNARSILARTSAALAIALIRLNKLEEADEVIADLARTNGGAPLVGLGDEMAANYNRVNTAMAKSPRGKLLLSVNDPNALIFVNEVGVGRGGSFSADMIPGTYRVLVISNRTALRYDALVASDVETKLDLDWSIETRLHVEGDRIWIDLKEDAEPTESRLQDIARRLWHRSRSPASRVTGVRSIVFAVGKSCGRRIATAFRYPSTSGAFARVVLGNAEDGERFQALATTAIEGKRSSDLVYPSGDRSWCTGVEAQNGDEPSEPSMPASEGSSTRLIVPLALGVAAFAGGLAWNERAASASDGTGGSFEDPNVQAVVVASVGSLVIGGSVAALTHRYYRAGWASAGLLGFGVAATFTAASLIAADDDHGPSQPIEINDTATAGFVVGAVGLVSVASGIVIHSVADDEVSRPRRWMRWVGWTAIGAGVLSGGLALNYTRESTVANADRDVVCADTCTPDQYRELRDREDASRQRAIIAGAAGGVALVGGVVFLALSRGGSVSEPPPIAFSLSSGAGFVHVGGTF